MIKVLVANFRKYMEDGNFGVPTIFPDDERNMATEKTYLEVIVQVPEICGSASESMTYTVMVQVNVLSKDKNALKTQDLASQVAQYLFTQIPIYNNGQRIACAVPEDKVHTRDYSRLKVELGARALAVYLQYEVQF
jgi:hypothetical protein